MRFPRLLTILGPAAVLYVLAARASSSPSPTPEWGLALVSLSFSLTPLALLGARPSRRVTELACAGVTLAIGIASAGSSSPALAVTHDVAWLLAIGWMLNLALPRDTRPLVRTSSVLGFLLAAWGAFGLGAAGLLPPGALDVVLVMGLFTVAAIHQTALMSRGHVIEGAFTGMALVGLGVALAYAWLGALEWPLPVALELGAASLLWLGHLAWIDPRWRSLRRVGVPVLLASGASFVVAVLGSPAAGASWEFGVVGVAAGLVWWVVYALVRRLSQRAIWTTSGRLADAIADARRSVLGSTTLEAIATNGLAPLHRALPDDGTTPELFAFEPPVRLRIEAGGRVAIRTAEAPAPISEASLSADSRTIFDLFTLRHNVVRDPSIRALVDCMERRCIGAIVPCVHFDHLEGVLLLPRSSRSESFSRVELDELGRLIDVLGGALSAALAQRRAESHIHELSALRQTAEQRAELLSEEVEQLRGQCDVLGRGLAEDQTLHVAYSPSMRRVQTKAIELAPTEDSVWLIAGAGSPVLPVARFIHDRGPRWSAPFVVADCSASAPGDVISLLFGSAQGTSGWFDSATGGTLLLKDLPALSREAQAALAAALDRPLDGNDSRVPPRIIATSRRPVSELRPDGAIVGALEESLARVELVIPPLRERREDVPSLVLLAIDRACRVLGRDPVGIDQTAMGALIEHDWPGDVAELELVIELAVAKASGTTISVSELPPLAWSSPDERESLDGTYVEVERRLLERALRRSGGNKSEAARRLGLKRTTFLDKLSRYGLENRSGEEAPDRAVG